MKVLLLGFPGAETGRELLGLELGMDPEREVAALEALTGCLLGLFSFPLSFDLTFSGSSGSLLTADFLRARLCLFLSIKLIFGGIL